MPKKKPKRVNPVAPLTPAQIQRLVDLQLNASLGPERAAIERERADAAQRARQQQQSAQGFGLAAADLLKGISPATGQAYEQAAGQTGLFAKGFSDGLAALTNQSAGEANAFLAQQGSPQQVQGDQGGADVLYGTAGYIPASSMAREGAAFTAAANRLPATQVGQTQDLISQLMAASEEEQQGFGKMLIDLESKVPGLRSQIMQDLLQQELAKYGARTQAAYLANAQRQTSASITGFDPVTGQPTYEQISDAASLAADQAEAEAKQAAAHGESVGKREDAVKAARATAFTRARTLVKGEKIANPKYEGSLSDLSGIPKFLTKKPTWEQAFAAIYSEVADDLRRRYGVKDARVRELVADALVAAGLNPPSPPTARPPGPGA